MYAIDQTAIATRIHTHAPCTPEWDRAAASAYAMVAMTILNQTPGVLTHCVGALRDGDTAATWRFPTRGDALACIRAGGTVQTLRRVNALVRVGAVEQAHMAACELPWLDYAKAAFLLQCMYGVLGCFDSRNEKDFGVNVKKLVGSHGKRKVTRKGRGAQLAGAYEYAALCARSGGSAHLWDAWCAGVSAQWPTRFPSADVVSAEHVRWYDTMHAAIWRDAGDIAAVHATYADTQARMDAVPACDAPSKPKRKSRHA